jgi:hypothetical protein
MVAPNRWAPPKSTSDRNIIQQMTINSASQQRARLMRP